MIISAAKWCIYEDTLTEEQMSEVLHVDWHVDEDTNKWAEHLINWIRSHLLQRTKGAPCCGQFLQLASFGSARTDMHIVLDMMSTHPDHQRRGAGSMLVKWGTEIADSLGVESFIDGTAAGKPLYERFGFKADDWIVVPVPEKWKDKPEIRYFFYERARRSV